MPLAINVSLIKDSFASTHILATTSIIKVLINFYFLGGERLVFFKKRLALLVGLEILHFCLHFHVVTRR